MVDVIVISVIVGAVAGLLRAIRVEDREAEVISKIAASLAFVVLGGIRWHAGEPAATWLVVGLVLCAVGDALLLSDRSFDAGLASFLLGHLAYVLAFSSTVSPAAWPPLLLAPVALVSAGALSWLWPHLGSRRGSVSAYVVVITVMVWGATAVAADGRMVWMIAAGAILFYLSDLSVARDRFVATDFLNRAIGLPVYYAAQVFIALSI